MNINKLKANLDKLNLQQQQTMQKARDLQSRITKAERAKETRRKIILGAWATGLLNVENVRQKLRGFIQDKDKALFPDLFSPSEISEAQARLEAKKTKPEGKSAV